jgi:recombination protein RecT
MSENHKSSWMQSLTTAYPKFQSINPEKAKSELGFAMQIFQNNPTLQKCDPQSILNAVVNVARTSITLNPVMRLAYLIPRHNKCVLEFSYMGLVAMLRDNGCIRSISAHIVYADEKFDYDVANNKISHTPIYAQSEIEHNSRKVIGCYSRATLPNQEVVFEFMPMWEIDKVKSKSIGSDSKGSAWQTWKDEMIKKSVIKRHFKMLISGNPAEALSTALSIENEANQLIDSFDNKPKQITKLMNAFDDVSHETIQDNPATEHFVTEDDDIFDLSETNEDEEDNTKVDISFLKDDDIDIEEQKALF